MNRTQQVYMDMEPTKNQTQALEPDLVGLHGSGPGKETGLNHVLGAFYRAQFLRLFKG
jgi:hypothetical protein